MCFEYTYDSRVNIISEKRSSMTTTYVYKTLRKVVRVYDQHDTTSGSNGTTWVYNYDCGGNTLSKERYSYTTGTRGTALQTIPYIYDANGNPLSDGTWTYTGGTGRQLRQMSKNGMTVQFKYDHNGLRTQKIVTENGVTTAINYVLHGKLVTHMPRGFDVLHIFCILDETVFYYLTTHYPCVIM